MPHDRGPVLLAIARDALAVELRQPGRPWSREPWLEEHAASFVTWRDRGGDLRGCVGSLVAWRPLGADVAANAVRAALHDDRFPPVTSDELAGLRAEVSVLSRPVPLPVRDEAEALAALRPGIDGLILELSGHRATFLPKVWDDLPDPRDFLAHLKLKAGLPARGWPHGLSLSRYEATCYGEPG